MIDNRREFLIDSLDKIELGQTKIRQKLKPYIWILIQRLPNKVKYKAQHK